MVIYEPLCYSGNYYFLINVNNMNVSNVISLYIISIYIYINIITHNVNNIFYMKYSYFPQKCFRFGTDTFGLIHVLSIEK